MTTDLGFRVENACAQMNRYGGEPYDERLVQIMETLTDINDDLCNGRDRSFTVKNIRKVKDLLNAIEAEVK